MKTVFPILLIALSFGLFFTFIDPQFQDVKVLRVQRDEYAKALTNSNEVKKKKEALVQADKLLIAQNNGQDDLRLKTMLPRRIESIKFILDVSSVASKRGLILKDIQVARVAKAIESPASRSTPTRRAVVAAVVTPQLYAATDFSFKVTTSYETLLDFLRDLETSLNLIDVQSIAFESESSNLYEFAISGKIYSLE